MKTITPRASARRSATRAGRRVELIQDYGGLDLTTRFTYRPGGQLASLTAVNADTGDQVTTYIYGTTLADSTVVSHDLLSAVQYPDAVDSTVADKRSLFVNRCQRSEALLFR